MSPVYSGRSSQEVTLPCLQVNRPPMPGLNQDLSGELQGSGRVESVYRPPFVCVDSGSEPPLKNGSFALRACSHRGSLDLQPVI